MLFLLFVLNTAFAFESGWEKWELACHERSLQFRNKTPTEIIEPLCTSIVKDYPMNYRQLHGMVAEAFLSTTDEERKAARRMLLSYKCENDVACDNFRELIEMHERGPEVKKNKTSLKWAKQMKGRLPRRSPKSTTKVTGLCAATSQRAYWMERAYEMYCPLKPTAAHVDGCANLTDIPKSCSSTEALRDEVETMSGQKFMSATYLSNLFQEGMKDCQGKWNVNLVCGPEEKTYKLECQKSGRKVKCKELIR